MLLRFGLVLLFVFALSAGAIRSTVGTITSNGRFQIEGAEVWGQGTILEGAVIRTEGSASRVLLRNGSDLRFASTSDSQIYAERVLIRRGAVEGLLSPTIALETSLMGLTVRGENARAHLRVDPGGAVTVASLAGSLRVTNRQGQLLASLAEGNAVQLSPASTPAKATTKLTGEIKSKNYRYFLTDEVTGVTVELKGQAAAKSTGRRVTISGTIDPAAMPADGAAHVVELTEIEDAPVMAKTGKTPNGAKAGMIKKVGVIAGVVVAGAATTGLVVAGNDQENGSVSPQP